MQKHGGKFNVNENTTREYLDMINPCSSADVQRKSLDTFVELEKQCQIAQQQPEPPQPNQELTEFYNQHYEQTMHCIRNLQLIEHQSQAYLFKQRVHLPDPSPEVQAKWTSTSPKVVFLDLDETLIHCIDENDPATMIGQEQIRIDLKGYKSPHYSSEDQPDYLDIEINLRPGLLDSLWNLKQSFQLISYTASDKLYADAVLDFIDPNRQLFSARLYREHCVETDFGLVKDLRIIQNRKLKDLIIIDNSATSFAFNVNNGIPILPFYDNMNDDELRHLTFYLNCLNEQQVNDVRTHNEQAFGLLKLAASPLKKSLNISAEMSPHQQSKDY